MRSNRPHTHALLTTLITLALLSVAGVSAAHDGPAGVAPHRQGPGQWHVVFHASDAGSTLTASHRSDAGQLLDFDWSQGHWRLFDWEDSQSQLFTVAEVTASPRGGLDARRRANAARLKARARARAAHLKARARTRAARLRAQVAARHQRRLSRIERTRQRDRARRALAQRAEDALVDLSLYTSGDAMVLEMAPPPQPEEHIHVSDTLEPVRPEAVDVEVPFVVEIPDDGDRTSAAQDGDFEAVEWAIVERINAIRAERGLATLRYDARLQAAAVKHSAEMYELKYFSHTSPVSEHAQFATRITLEGIADFGVAGENLVMGPDARDLAERFVDIWMDSPGHRANILGRDFRFTGVGVYGLGDRVYATQLFSQRVDRAVD